MREVNKIIIHCSASPEGRDDTVKDIDNWHRQKGYKKIGYHYVIHLDGSIHIGRDLEEEGAHTLGYNKDSIGVNYIGGMDKDNKYPKDTRTDAQKKSLKELVTKLKKKYPKATVHGHNEFAAKACPSFDVKQWPKEENI